MSHFDEIQFLGSDCHGYFTSASARCAGVKSCELDRWTKNGRIENPARGVYRIANYPPSAVEPYVLAVLAVGRDAALYGESVLGVLNLVSTNPSWIYVVTPRRIRRKLGEGVKVIRERLGEIEVRDGIPMQRVVDAIRSAKGNVLKDRRLLAAKEGLRQGYMDATEYEKLSKELKNETSA